ncbi:hypothetical protein [Streptomyces sp. cmx-4-9]|uniref:hypothetical protein n=1 Tax=Streptomyces sp. cmx-4-9 TaxID=2790941 RepID=UPI00398082E6
MTEKPSLRAYLKRYAQGGIPREEMLAAVAAWDFEEQVRDELVIEPMHQDNTFAVVYSAAAIGQITDGDIDEIERRIDARG